MVRYRTIRIHLLRLDDQFDAFRSRWRSRKRAEKYSPILPRTKPFFVAGVLTDEVVYFELRRL